MRLKQNGAKVDSWCDSGRLLGHRRRSRWRRRVGVGGDTLFFELFVELLDAAVGAYVAIEEGLGLLVHGQVRQVQVGEDLAHSLRRVVLARQVDLLCLYRNLS